LQSAHVEARISPAGEVKSVTGYKEIGEKILGQFHAPDSYSQNLAKQRVEQVIGEGIVKRNMDQLFRIFPDSAKHIGESWHLHSVQKGDVTLQVNSTLTLRSIEGGVAFIDAESELKSDSGTSQLMGYEATTDLKGHQKGEYQVETATGMLLNCNMNGIVEGTLQLMGRNVPVTIETKLTISGRKAGKD
ncbi:MAG: DUF6263 family protein, partial [Puia sp.]|nr:DUF6263 family protein [Puia sp.]